MELIMGWTVIKQRPTGLALDDDKASARNRQPQSNYSCFGRGFPVTTGVSTALLHSAQLG